MNTDELVLNAFSAYIINEALTVGGLTDGEYSDFVKKSYLQKILPMTGAALLNGGLSDEKKAAALKNIIRQQAAAQARLTHKFLRVYRELTEAGAKPLCVKGITCRALYPEPDMRVSGDEDLLVSEKDFEVCRRRLSELGFISDGGKSDWEEAFTDSESGLRLELHRSLFSPEDAVFSGFNSFFGGIFQNACRFTAEETEIYTPSDNEHFLYLVLHAFKHFIHSGTGIRQLCDIAVFYRAHDIEPAEVFQKCKMVNADVFLNAVMLAGEKYFGLDLKNIKSVYTDFNSELDTAPLIEDIMSGSVYGAYTSERAHTATITANAVAAAKSGEKSSVLRSVFPPRSRLKYKFGYLEKHPALLPVAWAQRIADYAVSGSRPAETLKIGEKRIELLKKYRVIK